MNIINETNVDQFKANHESIEHWEIRKKFLLALGNQFSNKELMNLENACLNGKLLGCKSPALIAKKLHQPSKKVVRDNKKNKLINRFQRSFVTASDATSSEGLSEQRSTNQNTTEECSSKNFCELLPAMKIKQEPEEISTELISTKSIQIKVEDILVNLAEVANAYDITLDMKYEMLNDGFLCSIFFNNYKIATVKGLNQEAAKKKAADVALKELQKICYTIDFTEDVHWIPNLTQNETALNDSNNNSSPIDSDNVGMKMMRIMGWSGGGLGKNSQGITNPVSLEQQKTRKGFGFKPDKTMEVRPPKDGKAAKRKNENVEDSSQAEMHSIKRQKKRNNRFRRFAAKQRIQLKNLSLQEHKRAKRAGKMPTSAAGGSTPATETHSQAIGNVNATTLPKNPRNGLKEVPMDQSFHETPSASTHFENPGNILEEVPLGLLTNEAFASAQFEEPNEDILAMTSELKLAIVPDGYPKERLTAEQVQLLIKAVIVALLDIAEGNYVPRFRDNWSLRGAQIFHCDSLEDKKWLWGCALGLLPWPGAKLRPMDESALQKVERMTICVRGEHEADVILRCLGRQNGTLRVHEWTVVRSWQVRDEARGTVETAVRVLMEESQVEALHVLGFQPFCAAGKAYVVHHPRSSTENDEQKMQKETSAGDVLYVDTV